MNSDIVCTYFTPDEWLDRGTYWQSRAEQRSPSWHKQRSGRLTASNFGTAIGLYDNHPPEQLADEIAGLAKKAVSEEERARMDFGTHTEPAARSWYSRTRRVPVVEGGLCVPKWNLRIGASSDGEVGAEGLIEIKCPQRMYQPLIDYTELVKQGRCPDPEYRDHVWKSHYCQIMGNLAVTGRAWCDYVVYCPQDDRVFAQRFAMDVPFWERELYPKIREFIREKLDPSLEKARKLRA